MIRKTAIALLLAGTAYGTADAQFFSVNAGTDGFNMHLSGFLPSTNHHVVVAPAPHVVVPLRPDYVMDEPRRVHKAIKKARKAYRKEMKRSARYSAPYYFPVVVIDDDFDDDYEEYLEDLHKARKKAYKKAYKKYKKHHKRHHHDDDDD